MKLSDGDRLLFTGDSITDCGRVRPVGEGLGLGDGYVSHINALLGACHPDSYIHVLNTGISGNRVTDLESRWQTDILALSPDWLSIMIGINDVWRQFDSPGIQVQVDPALFETTYRSLLTQTRPDLKGLILMTPFFLESNPQDSIRSMMDAYGTIVKKLAGEFDAVFVDVQAAFDDHLKHRNTMTLCSDRVHPNSTGHMVITQAALKALDVL